LTFFGGLGGVGVSTTGGATGVSVAGVSTTGVVGVVGFSGPSPPLPPPPIIEKLGFGIGLGEDIGAKLLGVIPLGPTRLVDFSGAPKALSKALAKSLKNPIISPHAAKGS
jgi:hypothetical protein